jgi:hypothetical protein
MIFHIWTINGRLKKKSSKVEKVTTTISMGAQIIRNWFPQSKIAGKNIQRISNMCMQCKVTIDTNGEEKK